MVASFLLPTHVINREYLITGVNVAETQSAIERSREATESERMRLLELVKTLESKLNSVEQVSGID